MLEQIVRPFQTPNTLATSRVVIGRNTQVQVTQAQLIFGAAGTLPTPTIHATGIDFKVTNCDNTNREKSRQTHKVKVQQPGNPDNYVMVEAIDQIVFSKTPDDVQNDFNQAFVAFAKSVADAINAPWGMSRLPPTDCNEKFTLKNS